VIEAPPGSPDSEFARRVTEIIESSPELWGRFSNTVAGVVAQRNQELADTIAGRPVVWQSDTGVSTPT